MHVGWATHNAISWPPSRDPHPLPTPNSSTQASVNEDHPQRSRGEGISCACHTPTPNAQGTKAYENSKLKTHENAHQRKKSLGPVHCIVTQFCRGISAIGRAFCNLSCRAKHVVENWAHKRALDPMHMPREGSPASGANHTLADCGWSMRTTVLSKQDHGFQFSSGGRCDENNVPVDINTE